MRLRLKLGGGGRGCQKREKELRREILAFSISQNHRSVRIYGHYVVIVRDKTTFYRHPIRTFDFTEQDGNPVSLLRRILHQILPFLREPSENTKSSRTTVLRGSSAKAIRASQALREVFGK